MEASLVITARLEVSANSSYLSLSHYQYIALVMNGDPRQTGLQVWDGLTVQARCLSGDPHTTLVYQAKPSLRRVRWASYIDYHPPSLQLN